MIELWPIEYELESDVDGKKHYASHVIDFTIDDDGDVTYAAPSKKHRFGMPPFDKRLFNCPHGLRAKWNVFHDMALISGLLTEDLSIDGWDLLDHDLVCYTGGDIGRAPQLMLIYGAPKGTPKPTTLPTFFNLPVVHAELEDLQGSWSKNNEGLTIVYGSEMDDANDSSIEWMWDEVTR